MAIRFRLRRPAHIFSIACYTLGALTLVVLIATNWPTYAPLVGLAVSSLWVPVIEVMQWWAWNQIDDLMEDMRRLEERNHTIAAEVAIFRAKARPVMLFWSQADEPDAEGDIRNIGHSKINLRELRN